MDTTLKGGKVMDSVAESVIYSTREYNKFKLLHGNRPESKGHIKNLIMSYSRNPELASTRPILVNENFEIIDGQHRFQACLSLGLPVYYTIAKGVDISTARFLNANQKSWKLVDYLNSFVMSGHEQYVELKRLWEEYPMPLSTLMTYAIGHKNRAMRSQFRNGTFKIMKDKKLLIDRLNALRDVAEYYEHWRDGVFAEAYFQVYSNPDFDPERFQEKLKHTEFERKATTIENLREIERVYNWNVKDKSLVQRLF